MPSPLGYRLRRTLARLISGLSVRVHKGPLAGKRLMLDSRPSFRDGTYEPEQTAAFLGQVRPGLVVYDLGAHLGYYTLIASGTVGDAGQVVAFEPEPQNVPRLRRNLQLNDTRNVVLIEAAVGASAGTARFRVGRTSRGGKLADDGDLVVPLVAVDDLIAEGKIRPADFIKMDIEGAETDALRGMRQLLRDHHPVLLLSIHGLGPREEIHPFLTDLGYQWDIVWAKEGPYPVQDLLVSPRP